MVSDDKALSKEKLVEAAKAERARFRQLIGQLSEAQMTQPDVQGAWSVKDIVAHVTAWEERMVRWLGQAVRGETPVMPAPGMTWEDLDRLNEQTYLASRDWPLAQVLDEFDRLDAIVIASVQAVPEEDLLTPRRFDWMGGEALWHLVAANTYWHYPAHGDKIRDWLEGTDYG
jgi:hypothetical protein